MWAYSWISLHPDAEELIGDPGVERDIDSLMILDFDQDGYIQMREFFEPTVEERDQVNRKMAVSRETDWLDDYDYDYDDDDYSEGEL